MTIVRIEFSPVVETHASKMADSPFMHVFLVCFFAFLSFFSFFFSFVTKKEGKKYLMPKMNSDSERPAEHPFAGQNTQQFASYLNENIKSN